MSVLFRRPDGSFVIEHPVTGYLYHVVADDPLHAEMAEEAAGAPFEEVPEPTVYVPPVISNRQFYQQLAVAGIISEADALAAVQTGTIPAPIEAFVTALPSGERFNARMLLAGAKDFFRNHPLTAAVGASQGMTSEQIDSFFIAAAAL